MRACCEGELYRLLATIDKKTPCYLGLDFTRTTDLSVLVGLLRLPDKSRRTAFAIEMRNIPHTAQLQICEYVLAKVRVGGGGFDATSNGSYLAEAVHEKRRSIEQVAITTQWYVDAMPKLRAAFESRQIAIPADSDSIDDLLQVRVHNGIPKLVSGRRRTDSSARHGDFAIAVALAYSASFDDYLGRFDELMAEFG